MQSHVIPSTVKYHVDMIIDDNSVNDNNRAAINKRREVIRRSIVRFGGLPLHPLACVVWLLSSSPSPFLPSSDSTFLRVVVVSALTTPSPSAPSQRQRNDGKKFIIDSTFIETTTTTTTTITSINNDKMGGGSRRRRRQILMFLGGLFVISPLIKNPQSAAAAAFSPSPVATTKSPRTTQNKMYDIGTSGSSAIGVEAGGVASSSSSSSPSTTTATTSAAFKTIPLPMAGYGLNIPVSCWFPFDNSNVDNGAGRPSSKTVQYEYQINVRRIGQLLAGWDFIPSFASRRFTFPTSLVDGQNIDIPTQKDVVVLAHGYLGSPLDLGHFAERLAQQGFVCVAPQYPESLEASYPRLDGLDRRVINDRLIQYLKNELQPKSFSAVGHSMGAGTVLQIGDETWNRILLGIGKVPPINGEINGRFGRFADPGGRLLLITSTNDGAVQFGGGISVPTGYTLLNEADIREQSSTTMSTTKQSAIPDRAALVFDRADGPNHISFLAENTNEAMISFLSPLLPIAKTFDIPVLDFDKYVTTRDSAQTSKIILPLISEFLASSKAM